MDDSGRDTALRVHIHERLLDYALTHLTQDYVAFTENAVIELLSESLVKIPMTDPNSLTLPLDPFDTLSRSYGLKELEPYDQRWATDVESVNYIKRMIIASGETMIEKCWLEDAQIDANYAMLRPMSPILTIGSRRQTPKLGSHIFLGSIPTSFSDTTKCKLVEAVEEQVMEEPPILKIDDALDLKTVLDIETHKAMVSLFKSIPLHVDPAQQNAHIEAFLRDPSPPSLFSQESLFVPIFPRDRILGYSALSSSYPISAGLKLADLSSLVPKIEIEDEEVDRYKENMLMVDGWQTYALSSSPSPATPTSSQGDYEDQIDELFMHSSPNTDPAPIQILMKAKLDEVEIPRANKLGGAIENAEGVGEGKSLASFILPLIPAAHLPVQRTTLSPVSVIEQAFSVIGAAQTEDDRDMDMDIEKQDLNVTISGIYNSLQGQVPEEMILLEKLDEKDGLLMEVLNLPSPIIHPPSDMFLPVDLYTLVDFSGIKGETINKGNCIDGEHGFLRRAKGNHSLAMELSWIPFKSSLKAFTSEQVTNVADFADAQIGECDVDNARVRRLLEQVGIDPHMDHQCDRCPSKDLWLDLGNGNDYTQTVAFTYTEDGSEMVLTREERKRLYGIIELEPQDSQDRFVSVELESRMNDDITKEMDIPLHRPDPDNYFGQSELYLDWDDQRGVNDSGISFPPAYDVSPHPIDSTTSGLPLCNDSLDANKENIPLRSGMDSATDHSSEWLQYTSEEGLPDGYVTNEPTSCVLKNGTDHGVEATPFLSLACDSHLGNSVAQPRFQYLASEQECCHISSVASVLGGSAADYSRFTSDFTGQSNLDKYPEIASSLCPPPVAPITSNVDISRSVLLGRSSAVVEFAKLRSKHLSEPETIAFSKAEATASSMPNPVSAPLQVPKEFLDSNTIYIPSPWLLPATPHRYLASMDVIQKQCLVRSFRTAQCLVDLVERDTLGGVDIIVDPHTAVVFESLFTLPSRCEAFVAKLGNQSWRYTRLLVIFEAYPESHSYKPTSRTSSAPRIYPYSPPILKAVRKLRRDLNIAEACETKCTACKVYIAFANAVEEAAWLARSFGELAETNDNTQGAIWGTREWLDDFPHENEHDLASIDGMNAFASIVILCQKPLQDFLDLTPEERLKNFGPFIGVYRVALLSRVLETRFQMMESAMSSENFVDADEVVSMWTDEVLSLGEYENGMLE